MRNVFSLTLAACFMLIVMGFCPHQTNAEEIIGDVDGNGVVGLGEAIYALQVTAGMKPATIIDPDLGPRYSAWGTYTYSSGMLDMNFTFSNLTNNGPPIGDFQVTVVEISPTSMTICDTENNQVIWTREMGAAGDIVGRWKRNDTDNSTFVIVLDSNGSMLYYAYGDSFTKTVNVSHSTKTIDGKFSDWGSAIPLDLYASGGDCDNFSGREIREVYVAQDENYIYLLMKLNGLPDPTFRYKFGEWFHIRVTPPPNAGIMLASSVCGTTFQNGLVAFGKSEDNTEHQFECRFDKCVVDHWRIDGLSVWSDQDSVTICRHRSDLPILKFDFSMCDD